MSKKNITARIAEVEKQRAELEAERKRLLAQRTEQQRRDDTRRKIIIGGVVLADEKLREVVDAVLRMKITVSRDRALFGLPELAKTAKPAAPVSEPKAARPQAFDQDGGNA
jgi:hypothetical protein